MVYIMPLIHVGLRFGNSQPQLFVIRVLSPPAHTLPDGSNFCRTLCLDEISLIHTPAPQGNSRRYGYANNVAQGGAAGKGRARREPPPPQMAVSEFSPGQIGPLPLLLATDLDPDLRYPLRFWWHVRV